MPEEIELDIREQQEKLEELHREHEEMEREEKQNSSWTRDVSMSTALLAVVAAIAALHSGTLVNEALLEQNKAVKFQAQASDKWAEYQANSIKGHSSEQTAALFSALGSGQAASSEKYTKEVEKYDTKKEGLAEDAKKLEETRDKQEEESAHHMHQHHTFAYCVTFTQVAIALSAIAALTRRKQVWYASLAVGAIGVAFMVYGFLGH
jgi:uncharacterized membrane protein YdbT with pleckstrin-like domain